MSKQNYFQHSEQIPYHLSVGAVVFNDEGKVLVHRFDAELEQNFYNHNVFTLIRETVEPYEAIEEALERGLMEEAGSTAKLVCFLGNLQIYVKHRLIDADGFDKTTLYFAMRSVEWKPESRMAADREAVSRLEWHRPEELIGMMKEQFACTGDQELDESLILKRFIKVRDTSEFRELASRDE